MATNGVTSTKAADDGMIHVLGENGRYEDGGNLSHVKTGMTISPELFEKVWFPKLHEARTLICGYIALPYPENSCGWRFQKAIRESYTIGIDGVRIQLHENKVKRLKRSRFIISATTFAAIMMGWGGSTTLDGVA